MPRGHPRLVGTALAVLIVLGLAFEAPARQRPIERPPNLVLIIGDDHGWPYAGFMGSDIVATPNLDALAASGTVFTHVFASGNVCQPSLRTLLSGLESDAWEAQRARLESNIGTALPRAEEVQRFTTLPRQLARRGYRSFEAGKHWEGTWHSAGFSSGTAFVTPRPFQLPLDGFGRPSVTHMSGFLDSVGDDPFFLWLAPSVPHVPLDPPAELQVPYRAMGLVEPAVLYYANVTRLDRLVGEMLAELRARGLERDTLVVYLSDNGWQQDPDREHPAGSLLGGPRGKATVYELGTRSPTILHWPGHVREGHRDAGLATFADVNATLLDYADVPLPADHEGRSLRARAEGERERGRRAVFGTANVLRAPEDEVRAGTSVVRIERASYVRTRGWRYVEFPERGVEELYRIDEDPLEQHDLSEAYPVVAELLRARLARELARRAEPADVVDVRGRLMKLSGDPVVGLPVSLLSNAGGFEAVTDANGTFRIPGVPVSDYLLRMAATLLYREGRIFQQRAVSLTGLESGPYIDLRAVGAEFAASADRAGDSEVRVHFVDWRGRAVAGLPFLLPAFDPAGEVDFTLRGVTGADGGYLFDRLPPRAYRLSAIRIGCTAERDLWLEAGSRYEARQRLRCDDDAISWELFGGARDPFQLR